MRENIFEYQDHFLQLFPRIKYFYQFRLLEQFQFRIPKSDYLKTYVATMIFRKDSQQDMHNRTVFLFTQYLESIAGMYDLLIAMCAAIFGSLISTTAQMRWIKHLYRFRSQSDTPRTSGRPKGADYYKFSEKAPIDMLSQYIFYFRNNSPCSSCLKCCPKSKGQKAYEDMMDKGQSKLSRDFNYRELIWMKHALKNKLYAC